MTGKNNKCLCSDRIKKLKAYCRKAIFNDFYSGRTTTVMKNPCFSLVLALVFLSAVIGIKAQSQTSAFAGNWMLDKEKTNTSKDFPQKLKNYKMAISGTESNINVKSQVDGYVPIEAEGRGAVTPVTQSASRMGNPQPTGEVKSATSGTEKINYCGTMALFFTTNDAVYNLNGEEVKIETPQGLVKVKAKPDKSGKSLQFTTIRRIKTPNGEMEVTTREVWKLSEDGKSIKLLRTFETTTVRDEITMIFAKVG